MIPNNIYHRARMEAAKKDPLFANRERVAPMVLCSQESLADYENGATLPPCGVVQAMVDAYSTPDLRGEHIRACCPLVTEYGSEQPSVLAQAALGWALAFGDAGEVAKQFAAVARDGRITPEGTGISPEAQAEIDRLRAEIATQEDYLERQAEKRQRAERELLQLQQQVARGETGPSMEGGLTLDAFAEAARVFVGKAGPLPHMGGQLSRMSMQEREAWQSYVDMVAGWLEAVQVAMNAVEGVVIHER